MVHKHTSEDEHVDPAYAGRLSHVPVPKNRWPRRWHRQKPSTG